MAKKGATIRQQSERNVSYRAYSHIALAFLLLAALLLGGNWLMQSENLPLRSVKVHGEIHYLEREMVYELVGRYAEEGFLRLDISALQSELEEIEWVESAAIRRNWPDTLVVVLTEQQPLVSWNGSALINQFGELYKAEPVGYLSSLPRLVGPKGRYAMVLEFYQRAQPALQAMGLELAELSVDERHSITVELDNGIRLYLGRIDGFERLQRFIAAYPVAFAERWEAIARVDLRYTNGLAVGWREETRGETG